MNAEVKEFSVRLRSALRSAGIEARATVLERHFNTRYKGSPITSQTASSWLTGRSMPRQDKIRVLAQLTGMAPHQLQFGTGGVRESSPTWPEATRSADRAAIDALLALPAPQRKVVRSLIMMLLESQRAR